MWRELSVSWIENFQNLEFLFPGYEADRKGITIEEVAQMHMAFSPSVCSKGQRHVFVPLFRVYSSFIGVKEFFDGFAVDKKSDTNQCSSWQ